MRIRQIRNLLSIRNNYHPFLNTIFRNYGNSIVNLFVYLIAIISGLVVLAGFFFLLLFFFNQSGINIFYTSSKLVFMYSLLFTLRAAYSYLYSGADQNILKALPIKRNEIIVANIIYFYRNQLFISFFVFTTAFVAHSKLNVPLMVLGLLLFLIVPLSGILLSLFLSSIFFSIRCSIKKDNLGKKLIYNKQSVLISLIRFERICLFQFSSLLIEYISFIFLYICIIFAAINRNYKLLGIILLFPAMSVMNISSFSREGTYHNNFETFPISDRVRVFSKALFFYSIHSPFLLICFFLLFFVIHNVFVILALIPSSILFINIALSGICYDKKTPMIDWTNPQEAIRLNIPLLLFSLLLGAITALFIFLPDLVFISSSTGLIIATLFNILFFIALLRKI